jgi:hypothetical protein
VEVEDILHFSRFSEQEELFKSAEERLNNLGETWGASSTASVTNLAPAAIPAGAERKVMCHLHIAAFRQPKRWWLSAANLTLELELNGDDNACFAGTGNSWVITRPTLLASILQVDPAVTNGLSSYLSSGKHLSIVCPETTWNTKAAITSTGVFQIPIQRGFSTLSCLQFSFWSGKAGTKEVTCFQHPLYGAVPDTTNDDFSYHVSVGSSRWPAQDVVGVAEAWYRTRMALTLFDHDASREIGITPHGFRSEDGIFCVNMSRVLEDPSLGHSGVSTLGSQSLVLHLKNLLAPVTIDGVEQPRLIFVSCRYDATVEIGKEGCRAYS